VVYRLAHQAVNQCPDNYHLSILNSTIYTAIGFTFLPHTSTTVEITIVEKMGLKTIFLGVEKKLMMFIDESTIFFLSLSTSVDEFIAQLT